MSDKSLFPAKCTYCGHIIDTGSKKLNAAQMYAHIATEHPDKLEQYTKALSDPL